MTEALIVDAVRTPIGRRNGVLAGVRAEELAAQVLNGLVARLDLDPGEIEDVQMGCVSQVGEQALNVARMSALVAGWPETCAGRRSTASAAPRCRQRSTQLPRSGQSPRRGGRVRCRVDVARPMGSNLTANGFEGFSPSSTSAGRSSRRASRPR